MRLLLILPVLGLSACATVDTPSSTAQNQSITQPAQDNAVAALDSASAPEAAASTSTPGSARIKVFPTPRSTSGRTITSSKLGEYTTTTESEDLAMGKVNLKEDTDLNSSIWEKMRGSFQITTLSRREVDKWRNYFGNRPKMVTAIFDRSKPFLYHVVKEVEARDLPMELALLPAIESGFHPFAYSHSHASGLWQFVPMTANRFRLANDQWMDYRRDLNASTNAALDYLTYLHDFFNGDWLLAIAAYNAGEGRVSRAVQKNLAAGLPTDFWNLDLPKETRDYVPRLLAISQLVREPQAYGLTLPTIPATPALASIAIQQRMNLSDAARMLNMSIDDLKRLNAGLKQDALPPNREYKLAIPRDKLKDFSQALASLTGDAANGQRHVLARGENLASVAQVYGVDEEDLKRLNPRASGRYQAGETILVNPAPVRYPSSLLAFGNNRPTGKQANTQTTTNLALATPQTPSRRITTTLSSLLHGRSAPRASASLIADAAPSANTPPQGKFREIVVKAGETLYRIARTVNIPIEDLRRWNNLAAEDNLKAGQRLVIADTGMGLPSARFLGNGNNERVGADKKVTYVVQLGDTLYSIARRFNVAFHQVLSWNKLGGKLELRPGDILTLYVKNND